MNIDFVLWFRSCNCFVCGGVGDFWWSVAVLVVGAGEEGEEGGEKERKKEKKERKERKKSE